MQKLPQSLACKFYPARMQNKHQDLSGLMTRFPLDSRPQERDRDTHQAANYQKPGTGTNT